MLQEPESLWVQVLKGFYFPNKTIMGAKKRQEPPWPGQVWWIEETS